MTGRAVEGKSDTAYMRLGVDRISLDGVDNNVVCLNDHCPDNMFDACKKSIS